MKAQVFAVSLLDADDQYFPDGSERFSLWVNVKRGTPEWDALFDAFRNRKPIDIDAISTNP